MTKNILPLETFLDTLTKSEFTNSVSLEIDLHHHLGNPKTLHKILAENHAFCANQLPLAV